MNKLANNSIYSCFRLVLTGVTLCLGFSVLAAEMPQPTAVVDTSGGPVQGLVVDDIHTFKGIRYGKAPVGELRFLPPEPPQKSADRIDATQFGAPCVQMASGSTAVPTSDYNLMIKTVFPTPSEMKIDNEDCLFLNVWTPATGDDKERPVMVWFHGGGYAYGSASWPVYDGENLSRRGDAVVVSVNHRLNVFGYLHLAELLGEKYKNSGNAGMQDLVLSLRWIRDNIASFGGDPDNVTIMGESGGGSKVSHLMAMPSAQGLFHKAVIQSGPGLTATPADTASNMAETVLKNLNIENNQAGLAKLQSVTADELLAAGAAGGMRFAPVVDGDVLPRHPFTPNAPEMSKDIPILIGSNKDEMTIFQASESWFGNLTNEQLQAHAERVPNGTALLAEYRSIYPGYSATHLRSVIDSSRFTFGSMVLAERKAAQNAAPVYMYFLTWETPVNNGMFRTPHTLDMPLMFDTVEKSLALVGTGPEPQQMADLMSEAWIAFAKTGNPNTEALPQWPTYDANKRATMILDLPSKVVNDPNSNIRKILSNIDD